MRRSENFAQSRLRRANVGARAADKCARWVKPVRLDPGKYTVTVKGPSGSKTIDVEIGAGQRVPQHLDMGNVNYEELESELAREGSPQ